MSFCVGIKVREGLIAIADTRLTAGHELSVARKLRTYEGADYAMFTMCSGLRSVTDKAHTYFEEHLNDLDDAFPYCSTATSAIGAMIRRVREEDGPSLRMSELDFSPHILVGGQFRSDSEPRLYHVYPEGNWVEILEDTPYQIIGASGYGKPVLNRIVHHEDDLRFAFVAGCLALDSARLNTSDVGYPMDTAILRAGTHHLIKRRYGMAELEHLSAAFQARMRDSVNELATSWIDRLLDQEQAAG